MQFYYPRLMHMKHHIRIVVTLLACCLIPGRGTAAILDVPGNYVTIQLALNACATGDTVLVQPGVHAGNINWPNTANIKLFSAGDSSNTTITGYMANTVIRFTSLSLVDTNTVIRGFRITG